MNLRYLVWFKGSVLVSTLCGAFPTDAHAAGFIERHSLPADRFTIYDTVARTHLACVDVYPDALKRAA